MINPVTDVIQWPPGLDDKTTPAPIRKALAEFRELQAGYKERDRELVRAERDFEIADQAAICAAADALRAGRAAPADTIEQQRADLDRDKRELRVLEQAVRDSFAALVGLIDQHREKWTAALEGAGEQDRAELVTAVDQVAVAESRLKVTLTRKLWLAGFPQHRQLPAPRIGAGSLLRPSGDPYASGDLIGALHAYATGEPQRLANHRLAPGAKQTGFPAPETHRTPSGAPGVPGNALPVTADGAVIMLPSEAA